MNFWDTISTDLKNRFRRNFRMSKGNMDFEKFLNENNTNRSIVWKAFRWNTTSEGFGFWNMIDSKWFDLCLAEKAGNEEAKARLASELGHIQLG